MKRLLVLGGSSSGCLYFLLPLIGMTEFSAEDAARGIFV
jgi:hypothetical protein